MSRPVAALGLGLGLALAACHDATDHEKQRVIGRIDPVHTSVPVIVAPAEAQAHEAFTVLVNTVGSSDCTKPDGVVGISAASRTDRLDSVEVVVMVNP